MEQHIYVSLGFKRLNERLGGQRASLGYLEKRKISCPYEDLKIKYTGVPQVKVTTSGECSLC